MLLSLSLSFELLLGSLVLPSLFLLDEVFELLLAGLFLFFICLHSRPASAIFCLEVIALSANSGIFFCKKENTSQSVSCNKNSLVE